MGVFSVAGWMVGLLLGRGRVCRVQARPAGIALAFLPLFLLVGVAGTRRGVSALRPVRASGREGSPRNALVGARSGASAVALAPPGSLPAPAAARTGGGARLPARAAICAIGALALAEVVTAYGDPRYGVALHVGLLAVFLCLGVLGSDERVQALFLALTVAPLVRIVSLGMPLGAFPQPLWYLLSSVPLFMATYLVVQLLGIPCEALGLRLPGASAVPVELVVCAGGLGLGLVEWLILRPRPIIDGSSVALVIGVGLILLICTGLLEELIFRGLIQHVAGELLGPNGGLLLTAATFGVLHFGHRSLVDVAFVMGVALLFGLAVRRTGSLLGVTLAHGLTNFMLFVVLPLAFG